MPPPLVSASAEHADKCLDTESFVERIAARSPYELHPKANADAEGFQRWQCPAAGSHPTVRCPLKKQSMRHTARPIVQPSRASVGLSAVCEQQSITIPPQAGAKHAQALPYASPEWQRAYATLRNSVEGVNGYAKNPDHGANLEDAGLRRLRGIAAQTFLLAFQLAAVNRRKQQVWYRTHQHGE